MAKVLYCRMAKMARKRTGLAMMYLIPSSVSANMLLFLRRVAAVPALMQKSPAGTAIS
jgi:hypothetical protein